MENVRIILQSRASDTGSLDAMARSACDALRPHVDAKLEESARRPGAGDGVTHKGDPVTIGAIVLAFITGGAAKALIDALRPLFDNTADLEVEIKGGGDDKGVKIVGKRLRPEQVKALTDQLEAYLEGRHDQKS